MSLKSTKPFYLVLCSRTSHRYAFEQSTTTNVSSKWCVHHSPATICSFLHFTTAWRNEPFSRKWRKWWLQDRCYTPFIIILILWISSKLVQNFWGWKYANRESNLLEKSPQNISSLIYFSSFPWGQCLETWETVDWNSNYCLKPTQQRR